MSNEISKVTEDIKHHRAKFDAWKEEIHKVIIGQENMVDAVLKTIISDGHILLDGASGLAKTSMIMALGKTVSNTKYKRIRFNPDTLSSDFTGTAAYNPQKGYHAVKGPAFANFIHADEINRAPPKIISSLFSIMQDNTVTIGQEHLNLPKPFFVIATQNTSENAGTNPLSETQADNFFFKIMVDYPSIEEEKKIIENNMQTKKIEQFKINAAITPENIAGMQQIVKETYVSPEIKTYIVSIVDATRNPGNYKIECEKYIEMGASPRASIALYTGSQASAFLAGRNYVIPEDVRSVAHNVLRHRIRQNYEGKTAQISTDKIIDQIIKKVPVK